MKIFNINNFPQIHSPIAFRANENATPPLQTTPLTDTFQKSQATPNTNPQLQLLKVLEAAPELSRLSAKKIKWLSEKNIYKTKETVDEQKSKIKKHPQFYINGDYSYTPLINSHIDEFFHIHIESIYTAATVFDKETFDNLFRLRLNKTEKYMQTLLSFNEDDLDTLGELVKRNKNGGKSYEYIDLIKSYKNCHLDIDIIKNMIAENNIDIPKLQKNMLVQIMKNVGFSNKEIETISEEKLMDWDMRYIHFYTKWMTAAKDDIFTDVFRAANSEPDFMQYLHNPLNIYGKANLETKEIFQNANLNYENWIRPNKKDAITFVAKDKASEELQYYINEIKKEMNSLINSPLNNIIKKQIPHFIKDGQFYIPQNYTTSPVKVYELLAILTDTSNKGQLAAKIWNRAQANLNNPEKAKPAAHTIDVHDNLLYIMDEIEQLPPPKTEKILDLTIKMWDRHPQKDCFQGNYSTCCVGIGDANCEAMLHYLMNTSFNMIELVDNNTQKTIGNALCYFVMQDNKPALIIDNIEINKAYDLQNTTGLRLRNQITNFAAKIAQKVTNTDDTPIYISGNFNDVPDNDLRPINSPITFLGKIESGYTYLDLYKGWVNNDGLRDIVYLFKLN